jgi:signal transduction histidine kinase
VSDNGPGIPKEHLQNIFKMFFRATNRTPGSGLGLYIVQETVGRLGGMVTVQSEIDKGTTFFISLPYKKE